MSNKLDFEPLARILLQSADNNRHCSDFWLQYAHESSASHQITFRITEAISPWNQHFH